MKRRLLQSSAFTDNFTKWTNTEWNAASWTSTVFQEYSKMDLKTVKKFSYLYNFLRAINTQFG